jgi:hypothetical protein
MKKFVIAAALVAISASGAAAQRGPDGRGPGRGPAIVIAPPPPPPVWSRGAFPYEARHHDVCHRKAWRLRAFERHAAADGYISRSEQFEISSLRRDLRRTCGGHSWRG